MIVINASLRAGILRSLVIVLFTLSCRTSALAQWSAAEAPRSIAPLAPPLSVRVSSTTRDGVREASSRWTLLMSAVSVSSAIAAVVTGLRARDLHDVLERHCARDGSCAYEAFHTQRERGRALHRSSIGLSIGALATAAAAALLFVRDRRRARGPQLDLSLRPSGLEARLAATF